MCIGSAETRQVGGLTNGGLTVEVRGVESLRGDAGVVQFSALAAELAGLLEFAVAFGPDLGLKAGELVVRGDVADGAVQAAVVVVVDAVSAVMGRGGGAIPCAWPQRSGISSSSRRFGHPAPSLVSTSRREAWG